MDKRKEANLHVKNSITDALIALMNEKALKPSQFLKSQTAPGFPASPTTGISTVKKIF